MDFNFSGCQKKQNGKTAKVAYYVMNFMEYGELFRLIEISPLLSERAARYFFKKLIRACDYVHNQYTAHRDIKTENVLIDSNFDVI